MSGFNKYDLEKRTTDFSKKIIAFLKTIKKDPLTIPIINQLIRSATSIGANYMEANGASSRKDFKNKIHICKKEAKETMYWLELLAETDLENKNNCQELWKENREITLIFSKIAKTLNQN